jgi:hypothetical protein
MVLGDRVYSPDGSDSVNDLPDITDTDLMEMKYIDQIFSEASRYIHIIASSQSNALTFFTSVKKLHTFTLAG